MTTVATIKLLAFSLLVSASALRDDADLSDSMSSASVVVLILCGRVLCSSEATVKYNGEKPLCDNVCQFQDSDEWFQCSILFTSTI